jgi:ParB family chromosome partitioning protein
MRTGPEAQSSPQGLLQIDIDRILPNRSQPREEFGEERLGELAQSIQRDGVLQPVIVRARDNGEFELIAGERRWRAAQIAGLLQVPALVQDVSDDRLLELALIENIQREELNPLEEASAYQTLIDGLELTQEEVARRVGKRRTTVTNALRLLNLPEEIQGMIRSGELSASHARSLAGISNSKLQVELARRIVKEGLSVRQVETLVSRSRASTPDSPVEKPRDPNIVAAEERLQHSLGTKVRIVSGRKGGRLELHYYGDEELQRIYDLLVRIPG